jgi:preprotein translocase subunit SecD
MIQSLKMRWLVIGLTLILAVIWLVPNFVQLDEKDWWFTKTKIVYGLDIQGGLQLVMGVDVEGVIREKTARMARSFESELQQDNVPHKSITVPEQHREQMVIEVNSPSDLAAIKAQIEKNHATSLQILSDEGNQLVVKYFDAVMFEHRKQVVEQAIEVIRNRIDEFGVSEPSISAQGNDRILVQLPGLKDAARAKDLINRTAKLDFRIVSTEMSPVEVEKQIADAETAGGYALGKDGLVYSEYIKKLNADLKDKLPKDTFVAFEKAPNAETLEAGKMPYLLNATSDLSGDQLEDAHVSFDEYGKPIVIFRFDTDGRRAFADVTEKNTKRQMAVVLDEVVKSAPVIQGKIDTPTAQITLGGRDYQSSMAEGQLIATALRAGALPAALTQLEERSVGPTLGADSIEKAKFAGLIGMILILLFMLVYYRALGVVADLSLAMNVFFLLAVLSSLGATLTLPGVAGIVLTLGMAVDANIIIFERIKEELKKGTGLQLAIKDGFSNAVSAIFDSNITTAIACFALMYYGTGPIRGFAVTLLIGIITSVFTAVFVSRSILELMVVKLGFKKIVNG